MVALTILPKLDPLVGSSWTKMILYSFPTWARLQESPWILFRWRPTLLSWAFAFLLLFTSFFPLRPSLFSISQLVHYCLTDSLQTIPCLAFQYLIAALVQEQ